MLVFFLGGNSKPKSVKGSSSSGNFRFNEVLLGVDFGGVSFLEGIFFGFDFGGVSFLEGVFFGFDFGVGFLACVTFLFGS